MLLSLLSVCGSLYCNFLFLQRFLAYTPTPAMKSCILLAARHCNARRLLPDAEMQHTRGCRVKVACMQRQAWTSSRRAAGSSRSMLRCALVTDVLWL